MVHWTSMASSAGLHTNIAILETKHKQVPQLLDNSNTLTPPNMDQCIFYRSDVELKRGVAWPGRLLSRTISLNQCSILSTHNTVTSIYISSRKPCRPRERQVQCIPSANGITHSTSSPIWQLRCFKLCALHISTFILYY
jgi:hypothetical protein